MTSDSQTMQEILLGIIDHVDDRAKVLGLAAMGLRLARLPEPAIDDANVRDRPEPEPIEAVEPVDVKALYQAKVRDIEKKRKRKRKPKPKYAKRVSLEQALAKTCPLCGAQPGEKCYVMARGNRYTEPRRDEPERHMTADQPHKEIHTARKEAVRKEAAR